MTYGISIPCGINGNAIANIQIISTYESDVNLVARFLMERFIKGAVVFKSDPVRTETNTLYFVDPIVRSSDYLHSLKLLSIDIECSMDMDLYSIALFGTDLEVVLMVDDAPGEHANTDTYQHFNSEKDLLFFIGVGHSGIKTGDIHHANHLVAGVKRRSHPRAPRPTPRRDSSARTLLYVIVGNDRPPRTDNFTGQAYVH